MKALRNPQRKSAIAGAVDQVMSLALTSDELQEVVQQLASEVHQRTSRPDSHITESEAIESGYETSEALHRHGPLPKIGSIETEQTYVVVTNQYDDRDLVVVALLNTSGVETRYRIFNSNNETILWEGSLP